jgi:hypothetical protein
MGAVGTLFGSRILGVANVFGSTVRGLIPGSRRKKRTAFDLIGAWVGGARLRGAPLGAGLKRRHCRWASDRYLLLWIGTETCKVRAQDLSRGGVRLVVPRQLEVGQTVHISAQDDDSGATCVEARVTHVGECDQQGGFPTGLEFVGVGCDGDQRRRDQASRDGSS